MEKDIGMDKQKNIFRNVNSILSEEDIMMLSPLQLAYLGDAVYELLVRTYLLNKNMSVNQLHNAAKKLVKANAQAKIYHRIEELLTGEEKDIVRRGRNVKGHTGPRNTSLIDYKYSTGFEALIGYLYIREENQRIFQLFKEIIGLKIEGDSI